MAADDACPTLPPASSSGASGGRTAYMRNRAHRTSPLSALRTAIDCMPLATRRAMLDGILAGSRILVGAYVDRNGGVCPMLAAHRNGGRTDLISFARSWDRFAGANCKARCATPHELAILIDQLKGSLAGASELELDHAIAEHRKLRAERIRRESKGRERLRERCFPLEFVDATGEITARRLQRAASSAAKRTRQALPA